MLQLLNSHASKAYLVFSFYLNVEMDSVRSVTFASKKGTVTVPAESLNDLDNEHGYGTLGIRKKLLVLIGVMISLCFILSISALSLSLHGKQVLSLTGARFLKMHFRM